MQTRLYPPIDTGALLKRPEIVWAVADDSISMATLNDALLNPCISRVTVLIRQDKMAFIRKLKIHSAKLRLVCSSAPAEQWLDQHLGSVDRGILLN